MDFNAFLEKYSEYLKETTDREELLNYGRKILESTDDEVKSFQLLREKEDELSQGVATGEKGASSPSKQLQQKGEAQQSTLQSPDQINEEILVIQNKNALLLSRKKTLEAQRDKLQRDYGSLMEESVQQKVYLKLEMQKLKEELQEALSRSRPDFFPVEKTQAAPVMEELQELNNQILNRINGFKQSTRDALAHGERAVLDRYKPEMEKILGQIYAHSEYLPVSEILEKFNSASDTVSRELEQIQVQLKNEHLRNEQLQQEAKQLEVRVDSQSAEVNDLKKKNQTISKEIALLNEIATQEIAKLKAEYQSLLSIPEDDGTMPLSARAVVTQGSRVTRKIKRSPSMKDVPQRETAIPTIPSVEEFIAKEKHELQSKISLSV